MSESDKQEEKRKKEDAKKPKEDAKKPKEEVTKGKKEEEEKKQKEDAKKQKEDAKKQKEDAKKQKEEEEKKKKEDAKKQKEEEKRLEKLRKQYASKFEKVGLKCPCCGKGINLRKQHNRLKEVGYYDPKKDHFFCHCEECEYTLTLCDKCVFSEKVSYEFPCPVCSGTTKCVPADKVKLR